LSQNQHQGSKEKNKMSKLHRPIWVGEQVDELPKNERKRICEQGLIIFFFFFVYSLSSDQQFIISLLIEF
jgi:hypothetical protein